MRELVATTFVTLDGVMQAPGGPTEDESGGFAHGGWSVGYWDDDMAEAMDAFTAQPFAMVLGRRTYEIMAAHWPEAPEASGARRFNEATKHVASRGRPELTWSNSVLIEGDAAEGLAALKREDGPQLQVHGSADLLQSLLRAGVIDRFHLWTFPVVLGGGKRLFAEGAIPAGLALVDSRLSTTGVVIAAYEPAGAIRSGSFA